MRNRALGEISSNAPLDRRSQIAGGGDPKGSYPTPAEMLFRIGVTILVALCVALAAELLTNALGG
jgi:hypothetical protein